MPASPSLAARAEAVLNQLAQVEAQEADRQARLEIENARQRASNSRQALKDALDAIPELAEFGVPASPIPSQTLTDLAAARRTLRTAATAIVGVSVDEIAKRVRSSSVNHALETAEKYSRYLDSALNRSVEKKRQEILPADIDKPVIHYPGVSYTLVAQLERLKTQLQRKVENLAPGDLAQRLQATGRRGRVVDREPAAARRGPRPPAPGGPRLPPAGRGRGRCSLVAAHADCPAVAGRPGEHRQPPDRAAPMSSPARDELLAVLDALEEADARNLAWGLTDESWTRDGLAEFIGRHTGAADPEACIDELLAGNLLVQLPREWPARYRTRMSEAVRLFTRLRQMFPGQPWQSGARLVSDFRFLRRPRAFPERNLEPRKVLAHLREQELPAAVLTQVERVLAGRDLSRFQLGATSEIFSGLASRTDRGVVVGAGTGNGKTLAFYLPALSQLAAGTESPRVIAIYPRNELLKDQLATALREVRGLRSAGSRSLVIGAYFGPTPFHSDVEPDTRAGWRRRGSSWICPFLTCPAAEKLRWRARMGASS